VSISDSPRAWSDRSLLKTLRNPTQLQYRIRIVYPEVTFLGVRGQPDFACVRISIIPGEKTIELKSLKIYFQQFRNRVLSYERLLSVIFEDLVAVLEPKKLAVKMSLRPRGGMYSHLVMCSEPQEEGE
jgi:7-cyano-7-deazaguanine reductase